MPADEPKKERHDDTFGAVVQSWLAELWSKNGLDLQKRDFG
jgi:hypothetical protein